MGRLQLLLPNGQGAADDRVPVVAHGERHPSRVRHHLASVHGGVGHSDHEMLAEGLGLERSTFLRAGEFGSHLLAPTATDLQKYGTEGSSESSLITMFPV